MKVIIEAYEQLDNYLFILNEYGFQETKKFGYAKLGQEDLISQGTIEISSIEELFEVAEKIHQYFKSLKVKENDMLVVTRKNEQIILEIYDGYREY